MQLLDVKNTFEKSKSMQYISPAVVLKCLVCNTEAILIVELFDNWSCILQIHGLFQTLICEQ